MTKTSSALDLIRFLCCPYDSGELDVSLSNARSQDFTFNGHLSCQTCHRQFPVHEGIISIMPDDFAVNTSVEAGLKRTEQRVRDSQANVYLQWFGPYTNGIEFDALSEELDPRHDDVVVDLGCGVGRYSILLSKKVQFLIAIDYSFESLKLLRNSCLKEGSNNILIIQADVTKLPLLSSSFNKIVSNQVLTLLPGEDARNQGCAEIFRILAKEGRYVGTVFNNGIFRKWNRMLGKSGAFRKEGYHPIHKFYYYNFSSKDISEMFSRANLKSHSIRGICNFPRERVKDLPIEGWSGILYRIDVAISRTPLSLITGDLLMITANK